MLQSQNENAIREVDSMAKECVAIVKVKENETEERKREKICYIGWSANYLLRKHKYFLDWMKTLLKLEKHLTGNNVNYELELTDEQEIAAEHFNRKMKQQYQCTMKVVLLCITSNI